MIHSSGQFDLFLFNPHLAMYLLYLCVFFSTTIRTLAHVSFPLNERSIGESCTTPEGSGSCQKTSDCTSQGFNVANHCPGASDIQCCVKKTCDTPSGSGICQNKGDGACSGSYVAGHCPGDSSIQVPPTSSSLPILTRNQCCVKSGGSSPSPPSSGSGSGIVSAAVKEEGLPYVWGGGGCNGKSNGGFDCSGTTLIFQSPTLKNQLIVVH